VVSLRWLITREARPTAALLRNNDCTTHVMEVQYSRGTAPHLNGIARDKRSRSPYFCPSPMMLQTAVVGSHSFLTCASACAAPLQPMAGRVTLH